MSQDYFTKQLKEGEDLIAVVKRYPLAYLIPFAVAAALILAPFFFLYPLFRAGRIGIIAWAVLFVGALTYAARQTVIYFFNALIVTDQRIIDIDQKGFFHRRVSEMTYDKVQDVSYHIKGPMQTFFRYGDIHIQSAGSQTNIEIEDVYRPEQIQDLIVGVKDRSGAGRDDAEKLSADELIALLKRIKKGVDPDVLRSIMDDHAGSDTEPRQKKRFAKKRRS